MSDDKIVVLRVPKDSGEMDALKEAMMIEDSSQLTSVIGEVLYVGDEKDYYKSNK